MCREVQIYSSKCHSCNGIIWLQLVSITSSTSPSFLISETYCSVNRMNIWHRGKLLCCLCPSFHCRPDNWSIWSTAQLCCILDDVGIFIALYTPTIYMYIPNNYSDITVPTVALFWVTIMAFILWHWKESLTTIHYMYYTNPYTMIFRVLNYSRKHKYPERCSILTYWHMASKTYWILVQWSYYS